MWHLDTKRLGWSLAQATEDTQPGGVRRVRGEGEDEVKIEVRLEAV